MGRPRAVAARSPGTPRRDRGTVPHACLVGLPRRCLLLGRRRRSGRWCRSCGWSGGRRWSGGGRRCRRGRRRGLRRGLGSRGQRLAPLAQLVVMLGEAVRDLALGVGHVCAELRDVFLALGATCTDVGEPRATAVGELTLVLGQAAIQPARAGLDVRAERLGVLLAGGIRLHRDHGGCRCRGCCCRGCCCRGCCCRGCRCRGCWLAGGRGRGWRLRLRCHQACDKTGSENHAPTHAHVKSSPVPRDSGNKRSSQERSALGHRTKVSWKGSSGSGPNEGLAGRATTDTTEGDG